MRSKWLIIIVGILVCLAAIGSFYLYQKLVPKKEIIGWKDDFLSGKRKGKSVVPTGWRLRGKPGTPKAVFSIKRDKTGDSFLHMEANKASGTVITKVKGINLKKTPLLRWRWRAETLPTGADGRVKSKDDQAIGIYIGTGTMLNKKTISYRWDTETPDGTEGNCVYGDGTIDVKWFTLRDKEDAGNGKWYTEERNCAEDFKKAWGFYPKRVFLSISCNSQYTGTKAVADLDWIEFAND